MEQYNILSLDANEIYEFNHYDGKGKEDNNASLKINTFNKGEHELSRYFNATMPKNLDTEEIIRQFGETSIVCKEQCGVLAKELIPAFAEVSFDRVLHPYRKVGDIYIKSGYRLSYEDASKKLVDSIFIKKGEDEVIAIRVNKPVLGNCLPNNKYFKYDEEKKVYAKRSAVDKTLKTGKELREELYKDGFRIQLDGGEPITYVRYKRSASNARSGNCIFINKKYFKTMDDWSYFNDKNKEFKHDAAVNGMPVEIEAYKALSLSSLEDIIHLNPRHILVLKDKESIFNEKCVAVGIENGKLTAKETEAEIKNTIWDGEGLLDKSVFDDGYSEKGMMLLRKRYFKCCAFNTNLQQFFKDNGITKIDQLNGYTQAEKIEDIKLVVTYSSLKIMKFADYKFYKDRTYNQADRDEIDKEIIDYWMSNVGDDFDVVKFGVVKTDKPTHYFEGKAVRTSYQILNTIGLSKEKALNLAEPTVYYIKKMRRDSSVFIYYLNSKNTTRKSINRFKEDETENCEDVQNYKNRFEEDETENCEDVQNYKNVVCSKLLRINNDFDSTKLYADFISETLRSIRENIKRGRILVHGTFATIFGNGYELLLETINKGNPEIAHTEDNERLGKGEVMTNIFGDGVKLSCARFPHVTMGNFYLAKNKHLAVYDKYFNLSKEIICVNAIGENIQQRLNGMDYDSDTMLITDNPIMYEEIKKNYKSFPVPVNTASPIINDSVKKNDLAEIDNKISDNYVGEIINCSQWINSIIWDLYNGLADKKINKEIKNWYLDACKLAVLSNMEIDKAKRDYGVDAKEELKKIQKKIEDNSSYSYKPHFMARISSHKNKTSSRKSKCYDTAMDYICSGVNFTGRGKKKQENFGFLYSYLPKIANTTAYGKNVDKIYKIIEEADKSIENAENEYKSKRQQGSSENDREANYLAYHEWKEKENAILNQARGKIANGKYLNNLIALRILLGNKLKGNTKLEKRLLWPLLYVIATADPNSKCGRAFKKAFSTTEKPEELVMDPNGDVDILGFKFRKK